MLSDDQPSLETVTSVDQLLQLLYPEYSVLQHCLRKEPWHASSSSSSPSFSASSANPLTHANDANNLWGQPRKAALHKVDGTLDGKYWDAKVKLQTDGFRRRAEQGYDLNANTWSKAQNSEACGVCLKV